MRCIKLLLFTLVNVSASSLSLGEAGVGNTDHRTPSGSSGGGHGIGGSQTQGQRPPPLGEGPNWNGLGGDEHGHGNSDSCSYPVLPANYIVATGIFPTGTFQYYVAKDTHLTWAVALERCYCLGLELTSIESLDEFTFINSLLVEFDAEESFWTSGSDLKKKLSFVWANNGHPIVKWYPDLTDQPDDAQGDEDCVDLRRTFPGNGTVETLWIMNDDQCTDNELLFICRETLKGAPNKVGTSAN